jgi:aldehyde:ferredoxin oxidoreductase
MILGAHPIAVDKREEAMKETVLRVNMTAKYGKKFSRDDLIQVGIETLIREYDFNEKAGLRRVDRLPDFFMEEILPATQTVFDVTDGQLGSVYEEYECMRRQ